MQKRFNADAGRVNRSGERRGPDAGRPRTEGGRPRADHARPASEKRDRKTTEERRREGRRPTDTIRPQERRPQEQPVAEAAEPREDLLEGRNPVLEALKAGRPMVKIWVLAGEKEGSIGKIMAMAREAGIPVQEVGRQKLESLSGGGAHQGVVAQVAPKEYVEVEDILAAARAKGEAPFLVILDELNDAHNFGSILRTCDVCGVHGVIVPKHRSVGLTQVVAKTSAGAVEYVPVSRVTNLTQTIEMLKKEGVWIYGTDATGTTPFRKADLKGPLALVIGSEGFGMGRLVREHCDLVLTIPMKGQLNSLNASVAAALVVYEAASQRGL